MGPGLVALQPRFPPAMPAGGRYPATGFAAPGRPPLRPPGETASYRCPRERAAAFVEGSEKNKRKRRI